MDKEISIKEYAKSKGVSVRTIDSWYKSGNLPGVRMMQRVSCGKRTIIDNSVDVSALDDLSKAKEKMVSVFDVEQAELNTRQTSQDKREKALDDKEKELVNREKKLASGEDARNDVLDKREESIVDQDDELIDRNNELTIRQLRLQEREDSIKKREDLISTTMDDMTEQEDGYSKREVLLVDGENALAVNRVKMMAEIDDAGRVSRGIMKCMDRIQMDVSSMLDTSSSKDVKMYGTRIRESYKEVVERYGRVTLGSAGGVQRMGTESR